MKWKVISQDAGTRGDIIYEYDADQKTNLEGLPTKNVLHLSVPAGMNPDAVKAVRDPVTRIWSLVEDANLLTKVKNKLMKDIRQELRQRLRAYDWAILPGASIDPAQLATIQAYRAALKAVPSSIVDVVAFSQSPVYPIDPGISDDVEIVNPASVAIPQSMAMPTSGGMGMMSMVSQDSVQPAEAVAPAQTEGVVPMKRFTLVDAKNPGISRQIEAESIEQIDSSDRHGKIITEEDISAEYEARLKLQKALLAKPADLAQELAELKEAVVAMAKYDNSKALAIAEKSKNSLVEIHAQAQAIAALPQKVSFMQKLMAFFKGLFGKK